jgi:ATP-binding protein involved in chromosome partitioning
MIAIPMNTPAPTPETVLQTLKRIKGPDLDSNIVDLGLVAPPLVKDGRVTVSITVPADRAAELEPLRQAVEKVLGDMPGVTSVIAVLTSDRPGGRPPDRPKENSRVTAARQAGSGAAAMSPAAGHSHAGHAHGPSHQHDHHGHSHMGPHAPPRPSAPSPARAPGVPGVKHIIAVASGKGGVGKSTTAVNLALGLQANGLKVGILDADVYGPSMPRLLGLTGRPQAGADKKLRPLAGYGLKVMSMGFLVEEGVPVIWRGPMVTQALAQMLREVTWGELDVLVVDMPPGTGDAQISMSQQTPLSGAVIVSTPQDLALIDARKGLAMFQQVDVPVLGIVENMSTFICPKCGERSDIFGHGGARDEAARLAVPFLGEVPLHMDIRLKSDAGQPVVISQPDGPHAAIYKAIAAKVWAEVEGGSSALRAPPIIVIE